MRYIVHEVNSKSVRPLKKTVTTTRLRITSVNIILLLGILLLTIGQYYLILFG